MGNLVKLESWSGWGTLVPGPLRSATSADAGLEVGHLLIRGDRCALRSASTCTQSVGVSGGIVAEAGGCSFGRDRRLMDRRTSAFGR